MGKAVALGVVDLMLSTAGHKADRTGGAFQIADEGAGDALFRHIFCSLFLGAHLHHRGAEVANPRCAR